MNSQELLWIINTIRTKYGSYYQRDKICRSWSLQLKTVTIIQNLWFSTSLHYIWHNIFIKITSIFFLCFRKLFFNNNKKEIIITSILIHKQFKITSVWKYDKWLGTKNYSIKDRFQKLLYGRLYEEKIKHLNTLGKECK